ncbi:MAG: hypothetical protein P1V35_01760 [Planctomycetota bacterium]|nr:hypothetical protein [Planctomycetota bacterium]
MNLQSRPLRFLVSSTLILALLATTSLAQNSKKKGFMGPPPPPPYNPEGLARWADVGPAKLAGALHSASLGDVEGAVAKLDAALAEANEGLAERLTLEKQRVLEFGKARDAWLAELHRKGKKLRVPVEGKYAAMKIGSIADGEIVFSKARKGIDRWPLAALTPEIMLTNLGKKIKTVEPAWLGAYLPSLAQTEFDPSKLKGVDANDIKQMGQYGWMLELGNLAGEIVALSKAGYPEGEAELFDLLKRVGAVNSAQASVPPLNGISTDLRAYAGDLGKRAFAAADLTKLVRGKATDLGEGRWKFVYEFDNKEEATDFVNDGELFGYCMPQATKPTTADKSGWLHNEGAIAWAGRVGLYHHVSLEGAMVARYEWSATAIGETFDIQGGNLIFGMCAAPKDLNFIGLAFVHSLWCYSRGQLTNNSNGPVPMYQKRIYKCELSRDAAGTVVGKVDGKTIGTLSLPKVEEGPFFLAANLNIRGRLERLELEGKVQLDRLEFLRKQRAWEYLSELGVAGDRPSQASQ